jgi:MoxR-like ATPase
MPEPTEPTAPAPPPPPIFRGDGTAHEIDWFPDPPRWRQYSKEARAERGTKFHVIRDEVARTVDMVNAALLLRRPLLVTGKPGSGKSTLAEAVAAELKLGEVLLWPVTTKTTLQSGLYHYDAIGRLNAAAIRRERLQIRQLESQTGTRATQGRARRGQGSAKTPGAKGQEPNPRARGSHLGIGRFLRLGPLGTALLPSFAHLPPDQQPAEAPPKDDKDRRPRVLLIDEIDKGDIDLPNDLLHVFERGRFEIPELARLPDEDPYRWVRIQTHDEEEKRYAWIPRGQVQCDEFPLVIMTSNGEREFPPAFLRRCLRLEMPQPGPDQLIEIVRNRLGDAAARFPTIQDLIHEFWNLREGRGTTPRKRELAVDQLLNAVYLVLHKEKVDIAPIREALFKSLTDPS